VNDNKELTERARAAYEHRRRDYGSVNENAIYFAASFAALEREAAVREFIEKYIEGGDRLIDVFREMFGKEI
jgi:hypothetical protein